MATTAPASTTGRGRRPCRSHSHATTRSVPWYSSKRATPTDRCAIALKKANCAPATATTPYTSTMGAPEGRRDQRPRMAKAAGIVRTAAAMSSRKITAAPGVHPVAISEPAKDPEVANDAAERRTSTRPPTRPFDMGTSVRIETFYTHDTNDPSRRTERGQAHVCP